MDTLPNDLNPLDAVTPKDWKENTGKIMAIGYDGSGVLAAASTVKDLRAVMAREHPEVGDYMQQTVPDFLNMTEGDYEEFLPTDGDAKQQ